MTHFTAPGQRPIDLLCQKMAAANADQLPLVQTAADGALGLIMINATNVAWPSSTVAAYGTRPLCVLIGGDLGFGSDDPAPEEWACARRLKYWRPNAVIVHAAAGEPAHYRMAAALTMAVGRLALIETTSQRADAWRQFLGCARTIGILPKGGVHPVAPAVRH